MAVAKRFKVTTKGVFALSGDKEVEVEVGTILPYFGDLPGYLVGKGEYLGEVAEEAVPVTNPAKPAKAEPVKAEPAAAPTIPGIEPKG